MAESGSAVGPLPGRAGAGAPGEAHPPEGSDLLLHGVNILTTSQRFTISSNVVAAAVDIEAEEGGRTRTAYSVNSDYALNRFPVNHLLIPPPSLLPLPPANRPTVSCANTASGWPQVIKKIRPLCHTMCRTWPRRSQLCSTLYTDCVYIVLLWESPFSTLRSGGRRCPKFSQTPAWRGDVARDAGACFQQGENTPSGSQQSTDRLPIICIIPHSSFFIPTRLALLLFMVSGRNQRTRCVIGTLVWSGLRDLSGYI